MAEIHYHGSQHGQTPKVLLLHGNLDIWVKEAKNLPNKDMFHKSLGQMFGRLLLRTGGKTKTENGKPQKVTSDPYVTVSIANAVIARTFDISNSENPVWMQHFYVPVAHSSAEVQFVVKDNDVVGSQIIGAVGVPVEQLISGTVVEGTFPVLNESGKPCKPGAVLTLYIKYIPIPKVPLDLEFNGVPSTYFPLRRRGKVTLYQDAHVDDGYLPSIRLDGDLMYKNGDCWNDICEAIKNAHHLIYITAWSLFHSVQLVRNGEGAKDSMLGDLLKAKSSEGVRVLLLIWDDPTSRSILGIMTRGLVGTKDEETRQFFKHSSVKVLLCSRSAGKGYSWPKKQEVETIYSHHQKTVIVDSDAGNHRRRIMAFVGGFDLCLGRYDTPGHPIFSTLQTLHKDDYHQPCYTGPTAGCPRKPWHDLHSRIEGPAAYDVLKNFEERWRRASEPHGISVDDSLLQIDKNPIIVRIDEAHCTDERDPESWHVQVFRSVDSNSVKGFPKDPKHATSNNLVCGKNVLIDMSIHTAYVKAIRAAQHFIYIENQFFLGSSFNWSSHETVGANNLIPMEIALKIANKIRAKERFAAYIVIPMWPGGSPTSIPRQRILFYQNKTMQMMYEVIYRALQEVGLENKYEPQDYLNFFCLGTRESSNGVTPISHEKGLNSTNSPQSLSRKSRRFMIYVHSKGMIVDDEFVILGSANINQRSLDGSGDTEIAMGAYQPDHTWAHRRSNPYRKIGGHRMLLLPQRRPSPHGQVFGYRMSLWAEHIGELDSSFERPESVKCVKRVRKLSEMNWKQYAADEVSNMKAHLLKYPVEVDRTGQVKPLPDCPNFPDMGGKIVGSFVGVQENLTI